MLCNARNEKMLTRSRHFPQKGRTSMRSFRIISIPSRVSYFRCQTTWCWWNVRQWVSVVNVHNENSNWYVAF